MGKLNEKDINLIKQYNYYTKTKNFPRLYDDDVIFVSCNDTINYNQNKLELLSGELFTINLLNNSPFKFKYNTKIIFTKDVYNISTGTIGYIVSADNEFIIIKIDNNLFKIKPQYNKLKKLEYLPFIYFWAIKPEHIYLLNKNKNKFIISLANITKYGFLYHILCYLSINENIRFFSCHMLRNKHSIFYEDKINNYQMRIKFVLKIS